MKNYTHILEKDKISIYEINGSKIAINICEDIWQPTGPLITQRQAGAELIVNINGSPFHRNKRSVIDKMLSTRAADNGVFISYVNMVGGQDELVFDGSSAIYNINVNTVGLGEGTYNAFVINNTNAINDFDLIPIVLNTQNSFLLGDLNQDGVLDVIDVVAIVSIIMGNSESSGLDELLADLNEDGVMNVQDIIILVSIILSN